MKVEERKIYRCEFCKKYYISKRHAEYHEKWCKENPRNLRPCHKCKNMIHKDLLTTRSYPDGEGFEVEYEHTIVAPYCKINKQYMYEPLLERFYWFKQRGVAGEQESMPTECDNISEF